MNDKPKAKTVKGIVKELGSQEKAAQYIGVSFSTVNRWLRGHMSPDKWAKDRFAELGIESVS